MMRLRAGILEIEKYVFATQTGLGSYVSTARTSSHQRYSSLYTVLSISIRSAFY